MQLFRRWGELTVWVRFSCSCVCPLLHCAHPILSGTSCSLSLLPLGEFILTAPCYWLCCFLCLQKLSHLLCLEKPCSFPLRPRSEASSLPLSPLICFLPGLLDLQKEALNHSNLCVPIIVFFFYKSIRALITLYWGMTCKILTSYISTRPISVLFSEFPTISTVPNTGGL